MHLNFVDFSLEIYPRKPFDKQFINTSTMGWSIPWEKCWTSSSICLVVGSKLRIFPS